MEALFQKYPPGKLQYVYTPFDGFTTFVVQAADALGRHDIKAVGKEYDGSPQNLAYIEERKYPDRDPSDPLGLVCVAPGGSA